MDVFELTHKRIGYNAGGTKIDLCVVSRDGREWSMEAASRLIISGQAIFLYRGEQLADLSALPEES
jgi:hypothetical protein